MDRIFRRILSELLDEIVGGGIPAGSWLPKADDIAARHACSVGTAREAIRALEERRLVEVHAGQGQEVLTADHWALLDRDVAEAALRRSGDPQLLREAIDALRLLEIEVAKLAAPRMSEGDLALLEQTLDRMRDSTDQVAEAEEAFHRTLALISDNRFLASALESLYPAVAGVRRQRTPDRHGPLVRAHERIMAALREHNPTAAAAAIDAYSRQLASWLRA
jgi:DNA-binding FadR family transcriptional regulator